MRPQPQCHACNVRRATFRRWQRQLVHSNVPGHPKTLFAKEAAMDHCFICRRPLLDMEVHRRVLPVAQHRGVMVGQYPSFLSSTSYAPVSLCLDCDAEQEQQIVLRIGRRWTWARRFFLGLLTYCFIGGIIKGEFLVLSWIGLAAIGWYMWHRRHTAQVPTTRSGPHKGGHYGTT